MLQFFANLFKSVYQKFTGSSASQEPDEAIAPLLSADKINGEREKPLVSQQEEVQKKETHGHFTPPPKQLTKSEQLAALKARLDALPNTALEGQPSAPTETTAPLTPSVSKSSTEIPKVTPTNSRTSSPTTSSPTNSRTSSQPDDVYSSVEYLLQRKKLLAANQPPSPPSILKTPSPKNTPPVPPVSTNSSASSELQPLVLSTNPPKTRIPVEDKKSTSHKVNNGQKISPTPSSVTPTPSSGTSNSSYSTDNWRNTTSASRATSSNNSTRRTSKQETTPQTHSTVDEIQKMVEESAKRTKADREQVTRRIEEAKRFQTEFNATQTKLIQQTQIEPEYMKTATLRDTVPAHPNLKRDLSKVRDDIRRGIEAKEADMALNPEAYGRKEQSDLRASQSSSHVRAYLEQLHNPSPPARTR